MDAASSGDRRASVEVVRRSSVGRAAISARFLVVAKAENQALRYGFVVGVEWGVTRPDRGVEVAAPDRINSGDAVRWRAIASIVTIDAPGSVELAQVVIAFGSLADAAILAEGRQQ
jgi:hypothetical protein